MAGYRDIVKFALVRRPTLAYASTPRLAWLLKGQISARNSMTDHTARSATTQGALVNGVHDVAEVPWYAVFPEPRNDPKAIDQKSVLQLLKSHPPTEKFVLVDLRRDDHKASETNLVVIISL